MTDAQAFPKNARIRPTALDFWSDSEAMERDEVETGFGRGAQQAQDVLSESFRQLELPARPKVDNLYSFNEEQSIMQSQTSPIPREQPIVDPLTFSAAELAQVELALIPAAHRNVREIANHLVDTEEPELGQYLVKIDYDDPLQWFRDRDASADALEKDEVSEFVPSPATQAIGQDESERRPSNNHRSHAETMDGSQKLSFSEWKRDFDSHMEEGHAFLLTPSPQCVPSSLPQQSPSLSMTIPATLPILTPQDLNIFRDPASLAISPDHIPAAAQAAAYTEDLCSQNLSRNRKRLFHLKHGRPLIRRSKRGDMREEWEMRKAHSKRARETNRNVGATG